MDASGASNLSCLHFAHESRFGFVGYTSCYTGSYGYKHTSYKNTEKISI